MLAFDATVQHPTWSHQIDTARADFKRMRTLCEKKMVNGLLLLANQQLNELSNGSRAFKDCFSSCDEALVLCGGERDQEMTEEIGPGAILARPHSGFEAMQRFRNWRRAQIEDCRTLAARRSQAVSLDEAVLLNPGDEEAERCSGDDEARYSDKGRVSRAHETASRRQAETDSAVDVDPSSEAAPAAVDAMTQEVSSGLDGAVDVSAQSTVQLSESDGRGREQHKKSDHDWQVQQNANAIEDIGDYKLQVATLRVALRKQAEDAQQTLKFVADAAVQIKQLEKNLHAAQEQVSALEKQWTGEAIGAAADGSQHLAAATKVLAQERAKSQALEEANKELRDQLATALSHLDQERGLNICRE